MPGHAKMAGLVAAGCGGSYMSRLVIVVDEDIDITNPAEVMWALATRWDPKSQTDIIDGCWTGHIDPRLSPQKRERGDITTSRMIIYAVRPFHWKDQFPRVNALAPDYAEAIRAQVGRTAAVPAGRMRAVRNIRVAPARPREGVAKAGSQSSRKMR